MSDLRHVDLDVLKKNEESLQKLTHDQLICVTLAEIIMCLDVPIGRKIALHAVLTQRAGVQL